MKRTKVFLVIIFFLSVFLLFSGDSGIRADQTIRPTINETITPTAAPPAPTYMVIDGPWSTLPQNSPGLTWDPELKAITLQTDPTHLVFVTQPDPHKDAFTNSVYSLGTFDGSLYLGYGDVTNNQGPVDIVSYNPTTGKLSPEMEDVPEEAVGGWYLGESGQFYVGGNDSRESWTFGSFYFTDGSGWRKMRTIYHGLHVDGVVEFQSRLYAMFRSDQPKLVDYPFILVSSNGGLTWQYEKLEEDLAQDTSISQLVTVHRATGDELYASADIYKSSGTTPEQRLYRFDGQSWSRITFNTPAGDYQLRDIFAFQDRLLVELLEQNAQPGTEELHTYSWDGQTQTEIPYLRGRDLLNTRFVEQDGWLYALIPPLDFIIPPFGFTSNVSSYTFVRSEDLQKWEELGNVTFQEGVTPDALAFSHARLYVGDQNTWREIKGNPTRTYFTITSTAPLEDASLSWDADVPSGASLLFQIKATKEYGDYLDAPWLGPDGSSNSAYLTPGQSLPAQQEGATIYRVAMSKSPNSSGDRPFVRTVTLRSRNGSTTFAVDEGSGLYAATNVTNSAQFTSNIFELGSPLTNAALFFDAQTPNDTGVTFQIRSGQSSDQLEQASFVGPDGNSETAYTVSGIPLWVGHNGDRFIQYRATLSSGNPAAAPFLRQVTLVTRGGALDHFEVDLGNAGPWVAGEQYTVQVTARSAGNQVLPLNGELILTVKNNDTVSSLAPQSIQLINGVGRVDVSLFKALPSQICVSIAELSGCSEEVEVRPVQMAWLNIETPDLTIPGPHISPHADAGKPFGIAITAFDRYNNLVQDYTGSVHCEVWNWKVSDPMVVPMYTFTAEDAGSHRFNSAVSFNTPGEYNLVCLDDANPQLGGALAITVGEASQASSP